MKLVSYSSENNQSLGIYIGGKIWPLKKLDQTLPDNMRAFLEGGEAMMSKAMHLNGQLMAGADLAAPVLESEVILMAPVPHPTSCRDGYAFRQHVAAARRNRGVP